MCSERCEPTKTVWVPFFRVLFRFEMSSDVQMGHLERNAHTLPMRFWLIPPMLSRWWGSAVVVADYAGIPSRIARKRP